ncbi:hypothetical protein [Exiguobacterium sp. K1]|uniref:hypothetical protein n=1 Tax=Exiguobacterium sp. K1 TaxID=2980105 RepID=UPI00299F04B9|nr:hypothetical protein [Exiguobacterium sp. K1]MDX1259257.1 hypothetical protein [Exiguobacterium sp. K1]
MKKYIFIGIVTVVSLPILVNFLAKITLFESFVVGEESTWISFFSGYLGSILGGIFTLLGVIITVNYQNNLMKKSSKAAKEKNIVIIESFFDSAFSELLFFIVYDTKDYTLKREDYEKINYNLKILLKKNQEIQKFDLHSIDDDFILDFVRLRELLEILTSSLEKIYNETTKPEEFQEALTNIDLKRRSYAMIESFLKIALNKEIIKSYHDLAIELKQNPDRNQRETTQKPYQNVSLKSSCIIKIFAKYFLNCFHFLKQRLRK